MNKIWFFFIICSCYLFAQSMSVAVIAPSISTSMKAREIRMSKGWSEVNYKNSDAILVVCRSGLYLPLSSSYDSVKELEDDANNQLNISGSNYHVYLFKLNDNLSVTEVNHTNFPAND